MKKKKIIVCLITLSILISSAICIFLYNKITDKGDPDEFSTPVYSLVINSGKDTSVRRSEKILIPKDGFYRFGVELDGLEGDDLDANHNYLMFKFPKVVFISYSLINEKNNSVITQGGDFLTPYVVSSINKKNYYSTFYVNLKRGVVVLNYEAKLNLTKQVDVNLIFFRSSVPK